MLMNNIHVNYIKQRNHQRVKVNSMGKTRTHVLVLNILITITTYILYTHNNIYCLSAEDVIGLC